jgi:chromosome segregation protein
MDNGAHFRKCDFQVHTPRDINWKGEGAVSLSERKRYATEFVAACRLKGLGAVAITDHHDMAFYPFIREAAFAETDEMGRPVDEFQRLVVFPGMELTLAVPCQALLILDEDFPESLLEQVVHAIDVTPCPSEQPKHDPTSRLEHFKALEDVYETLNKKDFLRGRFILLPHVGESGQSSMLRLGMATQYKNMPCVGGYVDGELLQHRSGKREIVAGQKKEWGNKAIAVFQTSDNRSRDFAKLGSSVTWIKWAKPTAEALRQACLARESRVAHSEPKLPALRITRLDVSNSKFMGPVNLEFNPQYNALIGGRGTGKSTLLEYLRWALCDQPPDRLSDADDDLPDFQRRRKSLVDGTLLPLDAEVEVSFLLNEVPHVVRRKVSGELQLRIGAAEFVDCREQHVRDLLPIRAYSQKQLSAVGARIEELRRFVQAPIQKELDSFQEARNTLRDQIREGFEQVRTLRTLEVEIKAYDLEQRSLEEQAISLRLSLAGLSPEDSAVINRQASYELERRFIQGIRRDTASLIDLLGKLEQGIAEVPVPFDERQVPENTGILREVHGAFSKTILEVREFIERLREEFNSGEQLAPYREGIAAWDLAQAAHAQLYAEAKSRTTAHHETLKAINLLEKRLAEVRETLDSKRRALSLLGDPLAVFAGLRSDWNKAHSDRAALLERQCVALTVGTSSRLRASLKRAADTEPLASRMRALVRGTGTRGDRIEKLQQQIETSQRPFEAWQAILDEMFPLCFMVPEEEGIAALPSTPMLDAAGFSSRDRAALTKQLEPGDWLELLLFNLEDLPVFEYEVKPGSFLPFEKASPGQQATALLAVLLLQEGPPLLIDQPEDDLNMKIISETVSTVWKSKSHRQIIFASHNANLVVNGDAELVICCDYRAAGTESGGRVKATGAIDIAEINTEIAEVMEGGVEAFKLRWQKYGF